MKKKLEAAAIIAALSFIAYSNSFNCSFHHDDFHQIILNPNASSLSGIPRAFVDATVASIRPIDFYRPVTFASFVLNNVASGSVVWFHAVNVLLHICNALLLFVLAEKIFRHAGREPSFMPALFCSLVFALHPVQTMAVTYISGRAVLLAFFFCMLALYSFIRYREGGGQYWGAAAPVFYLLGMFSKEMAATALLLVVLYDFVFFFKSENGRSRLRSIAYYLTFVSALAVYLIFRAASHGAISALVSPYREMDYISAEAGVFIMYLRLLFLPFNQNADYFLPVNAGLAVRAAGFAAFALLAYFIYRVKNNRPEVFFFGIWFLAGILPESVLPIKDLAVEYRLYLPSAGFIGMAVALAAQYRKGLVLRKAVPVTIIILLCVLTLYRNRVWADEISLWSDSVVKAPWNPRGHANLGRAYLIEKRYRDAEIELSASLRLGPDFEQKYIVYENLGNCYYETGRMDKAKQAFEDELKLRPDSPRALEITGEINFGMGKFADAASAYRRLSETGGDGAQDDYNMGISYLMLGRYREAQYALQKALCAIDSYDIRYNLALACEKNNEPDLALENAVEAEKLAKDEGQLQNAKMAVSRIKKEHKSLR